MKTEETNPKFDSRAPVAEFSISLANTNSSLQMDFSANPNILIAIEEFRNVVGLSSPIQAGILVNQDHSCWLTNLGRSGSTEVFRPDNKKHRKLTYNQVAYVRHGDCVAFYGNFFRVLFGFSSIQFKPLSEEESARFPSQF